MTSEDHQTRPAPAATVVNGSESGGDSPIETPAPVTETNGDAGADGSSSVEGKGPRVHLDRFEGPLDLLLFLIREHEVDITDIPIAKITDQYLATIGNLDELDLDSAGEYLVMATSLMRIKAKMLIPRDLDDEDDEDAVDPRAELVRRLLEYREFKQISEQLAERQDQWRGVFSRAASPIPETESDDEDFEDPGVSMIDLFRAFRSILAQVESESPLHMETESYSVDDQIAFIRAQCDRSDEGVRFFALFEDVRSRPLLITTFLALLEIVRQREIVAHQVERFGEIWLKRATEEAAIHE